MTKREILSLAGAKLGDQSTEFLEKVLDPFFNLVLADLASADAIDALESSALFDVEANRTEWETREICGLTPHNPKKIVRLVVDAWGPCEGIVWACDSAERFDLIRLTDGTDSHGHWRAWYCDPNNQILRVTPAVDPTDTSSQDVNGQPVKARVYFQRPWQAVGMDNDVTDIQLEDLSTIVAGLVMHGAAFDEATAADFGSAAAMFEAGKRRMWGNKHNGKPGRLRGRRR